MQMPFTNIAYYSFMAICFFAGEGFFFFFLNQVLHNLIFADILFPNSFWLDKNTGYMWNVL